MIHVAVIAPQYLAPILDGRKRVELRLSRIRQPWHTHVHRGERIYFKIRGGPIAATAIIQRVHTYPINTPADLDAIRRELSEPASAPDRFWLAKSRARHAVAIWLSAPEAITFGPDLVGAVRCNTRPAWCVLPDTCDVYPQCLDTPEAGEPAQVAFIDPLIELPTPITTTGSRSSRTAPRPPGAHTPRQRRSA